MGKYVVEREFAGRPMKIIHSFGFAAGSTPDERHAVIDAELDRLYRLGYGGIVTNVSLDNYLEDEKNWESLLYAVKTARGRGFRVWLYDEHGYPSGGAGGITLRNYPEGEAMALSEITAEGVPGETAEIKLPAGHECFIYPYSDGNSVNVKVDPDGLARAYAVKRLYEGTHAEHNVHESRRYINVLDPLATREFIRNTYEAYSARFGDSLGENVEAIFTDEPSIMAAYLNAGLYPGRVRDEFDDSLPLTPVIPWERSIPEKYAGKYGEDLLPQLHMLFDSYKGDIETAREVRGRFYGLTSEMFEEYYFKPLGDWCDAHGIAFSGHVLLEENLLDHPVFEGDIFRFVSHMGIPGIDMLTTVPSNVLDWAATPVLISSSARWYGRKHVMSEVSGHMEGSFGRPFGVREMKGSVALQRALGVDLFPSYYSDTAVSEEEFSDFCRFTADICDALSGDNAEQDRDTLLYYPVENAFAATCGTAAQLGARPHSEDELKMERSWCGTVRRLLMAGIGFDAVDDDVLYSAEVRDGKIISPATRHAYKFLVLPYYISETKEFSELIERLEAAGVTVIEDENKDHSGETETPLIITAYSHTDTFERAFLIVNYTENAFEGTVSLRAGKEFAGLPGAVVDPEEHIIRRAGASVSEDGTMEVSVRIPPCSATVVGIR